MRKSPAPLAFFLGILNYIVLTWALRLTVPPDHQPHYRDHTALGMVIEPGKFSTRRWRHNRFRQCHAPDNGTIAYIIPFIPVVVLGRFLDTRFPLAR
jgi:polar amino acid transport system permease protein